MRTFARKRKYLRANCKICELLWKICAPQGRNLWKIAILRKRSNLRKNCAPQEWQDRDFLQGLTKTKAASVRPGIVWSNVHKTKASRGRGSLWQRQNEGWKKSASRHALSWVSSLRIISLWECRLGSKQVNCNPSPSIHHQATNTNSWQLWIVTSTAQHCEVKHSSEKDWQWWLGHTVA